MIPRSQPSILGRLPVHAVRGLERLLPIWFLCLLFWPVAAAKATWELGWSEPTVRLFFRLPVSMRRRLPRPIWWGRLWRARTRHNLAEMMCLWPDRFTKARWRERCRITGMEHLEQARRSGRPVILAVMHLGSLLLLRYYLRSLGWPVAGLIGRPVAERPALRQYLDDLGDRAYGLTGVPPVFDLKQLRRLHEFLNAKGLVIVALDGGHGNHVFVPNGDCSFRMASGAVRLAAHTRGVAVPCIIRAERAMGICIHFGNAVPEQLLADPLDQLPACTHLFSEYLPFLQAHPEEASYELLCRFRLEPPAQQPVAPLRG